MSQNSHAITPSNSSPLKSDVDKHIYENAAVGHQLGVDRHDMLAPDISRVLVIYTGGTIGMKHTPEHGYIPLPNYFAQQLSKLRRFHDPYNQSDFSSTSTPSLSRQSSSSCLHDISAYTPAEYDLQQDFGKITNTVKAVCQEEGSNKGKVSTLQLPSLITPISLFGKRIRYSILEYKPLLDSCDITMLDWVRVAGDIKENYELYDAFIVLHGTDTMAYTASALSFMLEELGKTVIITGSQVPLTEVRNDAVDNLLGALTIAGHFVIPEVTLYFGKKLYRGNRTSKISAVDFEAFDSPNMPALVEVGINIDVKWPLVLRPTHIAKFQVCQKLSPYVAALRLFPGISDMTIRQFLQPPVQGIVLETFGAGNAPARTELLIALKEACDRGVVIVNCTQCRKGLVTDAYATGRQLAAIGVVPGADMTPECALTKLAYLLGKTPDNPEHVRRMMTRNLRGELTVRSHYQRFSASQNPTSTLVNMLLRFSARGKLAAKQELERHGTAVSSPVTTSSTSTINTELSAAEEAAVDEESNDLTMSVEEELLAQKALGPVLLCSAAASNDLEGISQLVESMDSWINLNCVDYDGRVPLHVACREGHFKMVKYLLLHGASIHVRDRSGHTPLFEAIVEKRAEIVRILRDAGAHLAENELKDMGHYWFKAIKNDDIKWVQIALDGGFNVNWSDAIENRRGIDIAVCLGRVSILKILLNQVNVEVEYSDKWGFTVQDKIEMLKKRIDVLEPKRQISPRILDEMADWIKSKASSK
ncbi:asparaginase-domain-containing protein [Mycotypha africana]|uniref:asparaginase-domain-containing protein n=1 Tax=Mycotypha africana TaxID=64632 RepID=UPI00230076B6|nr:asparaginase-domain-containing protein [Mycotypha africana]KAI8990970.1 asparaginase-domain-containing protein [Mycotypha africana]